MFVFVYYYPQIRDNVVELPSIFEHLLIQYFWRCSLNCFCIDFEYILPSEIINKCFKVSGILLLNIFVLAYLSIFYYFYYRQNFSWRWNIFPQTLTLMIYFLINCNIFRLFFELHDTFFYFFKQKSLCFNFW